MLWSGQVDQMELDFENQFWKGQIADMALQDWP